MLHNRIGTRGRLQTAACHARCDALSRDAPVWHGDRNSDCRHPPRATHSHVRPKAEHHRMMLPASREATPAAGRSTLAKSAAGQVAARSGETPAALSRPASHFSAAAARTRAFGTRRPTMGTCCRTGGWDGRRVFLALIALNCIVDCGFVLCSVPNNGICSGSHYRTT